MRETIPETKSETKTETANEMKMLDLMKLLNHSMIWLIWLKFLICSRL